jgi:hypothetical protein
LTDRTLTDKSFVKQSDTNTNTNTLAAEAADVVRKVKRHIEQDGCVCCKEALSSSSS